MKTKRQWIDTLPVYYKDKAIYEMENCPLYREDDLTQFNTAYAALYAAFIWARTKDGHDFWHEFTEQLLK